MDDFSKHEALDRSMLVMELFNTYLLEHEAIETDPELKIIAEQISLSLYDLYNKLGKKFTIKDLPDGGIGR